MLPQSETRKSEKIRLEFACLKGWKALHHLCLERLRCPPVCQNCPSSFCTATSSSLGYSLSYLNEMMPEFFFNFFTFIYFWETEWDKAWAGEGQREKEIQNLKQAPASEQAVSTEPDVGHKPMNREIMTWAKVGHLTDLATQAPLFIHFWERERETERESKSVWAQVQAGEGQTERVTENLKPSWCRAWTHELWDHYLSWSWTLLTDWATQVPLECSLEWGKICFQANKGEEIPSLYQL